MNLTALIFGLLALIFGALSARDYLRPDHQHSITARIRRRIAIIFAVVAVILILVF